MTNEEFQKIVLEELGKLNSKVDNLEQGQTNLTSKVDRLEQGQTDLTSKVDNLELGQEDIKRNLKAVIEQTADLTEFREETKSDFEDLRSTVSRIEIATADKFNDIEKGQNEIKTLLLDLDPKNANRHLELKNSIDELRKDLSTVEVVTASNYADIAKLKKIK